MPTLEDEDVAAATNEADPIDVEVAAIAVVVDARGELSSSAQTRVLAYLNDRGVGSLK